ncbi:Ig-like domain-containing protein [Oscillospiraceae bacterium LTW-04]|nr:Ig-like domain-containing protein [Oscillospiraceae bacterium MB24-C1]
MSSIATITATINGVTHPLNFNSSTGKWEATLTAPSGSSFNQGGGYYNVSLSAADEAGNISTADATDMEIGTSLRLVVKEKVKPTVSIVSPGASAFLTTNMLTITAQLRDADSGVKISTLSFKLDGVAMAYNAAGMTCTPVAGGYNISYTPQTALPDGAHTLTVAVADNDGNMSTTASRSFTVDTVAPTLNVISPAAGLITNKTAGMVSGTTSDATSSPVTLSIKVNGVDTGAVTVNGDGSFGKAVTYAEGSNSVVITAIDSAGKTTSVTRTLTVDTVPPEFVSVTLTPNPVDAGQTYVLSVSLS